MFEMHLFNNARIELNNNELVEVLSDETLGGDPLLWRMNARVFADRIFEVFPEARIFICIREQKKVIWSLYSEYIKHGNTASLEQFIGAEGRILGVAPICDISQLEYHKLIGYYQSLYGKDKVLILTLEQLRENRGDFIDQLISFRIVSKVSAIIDKLIPVSVHSAVVERDDLMINNYLKDGFHESNKISSTLISIDLKALGYD